MFNYALQKVYQPSLHSYSFGAWASNLLTAHNCKVDKESSFSKLFDCQHFNIQVQSCIVTPVFFYFLYLCTLLLFKNHTTPILKLVFTFIITLVIIYFEQEKNEFEERLFLTRSRSYKRNLVFKND